MEPDVHYYTVDEVAKILKLTPDRIQQMLRDGELEGRTPEEGGERGWKIPVRAVHDWDRPCHVEEDPESPPEEAPRREVVSEPTEVPVDGTHGSEASARSYGEEADGPGVEQRLPPDELRSGERAEDAQYTSTEPLFESGWVTTEVAAEALDVSPRTVRDYIANRELEAKPEGESVERRWLVSIDSVQEMHRQRRAAEGFATLAQRTRGGEGAVDIAADLLLRMQDLQYRLGRAEARAELSERVESTVREERDRLREENERLRTELAAERSRFLEEAIPQIIRIALTDIVEATQEKRESPKTRVEVSEGAISRPAAGGAQTSSERPRGRSFWRRLFGG
jgi:excisionase family DNA binding protein